MVLDLLFPIVIGAGLACIGILAGLSAQARSAERRQARTKQQELRGVQEFTAARRALLKERN